MSFSPSPEPQEEVALTDLIEMLSYMRPAWSKAEKSFIKRFIKPLGVTQDAFGNLYKLIPNPDETLPAIVWSCHTDTVHKEAGRQRVQFDFGSIIALGSSCLGADDGAGVWLMREMILAEVPGLYIFHRAEEIGGRGSSYIANTTPELLEGFKACVALDRAGHTSVITHQGERCCSDAFAASISAALNLAPGFNQEWKGDSTGIFTDSANYTDLIGECSNLSVGYMDAHSSRESLDVEFLFNLRDALIEMDFDSLTFERKPGERDFEYETSRYGSYGFMDDDSAWQAYFDMYGGVGEAKKSAEEGALLDLVKEHPEAIVKLLKDYGMNADDVRQYIWQ